VAGVVGLAAAIAAPATGTGAEHGAVVTDTPSLRAPVFLDGEVLAGAQVGNRIIVGGSFTRIDDAELGVIEQKHLAAYDADTGRLDVNFRPNVNNQVNSIADAGSGMILVGGKFRFIDGTRAHRIAKLRVVDGSLVKAFVASADAQVFDVAVAGDRAYVGGSFDEINGISRIRLAAVDLHTGAVDPGFDLPVTKPTGYNGASSVRGIDVSPDGTKLVTVHNNARVDGKRRQGIALIDISGATAALLPWRTSHYDYDCQPWFPQFSRPLMRDVQFSPDGTFLVAVSAIGNFAPGCDVAVRFPTSGGKNVQAEWISRMFDSPDAVAVTDAAVYVGGHMRWAAAPGFGWTDFEDGNPTDQPENTVVRDQLVALDPSDGQTLEWNPGAGGFRGVLSLAAVDGGLLAGSDGDRFGGETVGRHAFFELPADQVQPDGEAPMSAFVTPRDGVPAGRPFPLIVEATDDTGVADVVVTVRNTANGRYLQPDGTFRAAETDLSPFVAGTGTTEATVHAVFSLPRGAYEATATAIDVGGTGQSTPTTVRFPVGSGDADPDGRFEHPRNLEVLRSPVTLSGLAWDDDEITKIRIIVRDRVTNEYLQDDGTFAPKFNRIFVDGDGRGSALATLSWTYDLPTGKYRAWLHLKDSDGNSDRTKARVNFRIAP
jgi:hypothetical protein